MKKFLLAAATVALSCSTILAEGYQINTLSAKQIGMAHAGVAMKLGVESAYFNPAGMGFMNNTLDVAASVAGIMPTVTATVGDKKYTTDNGVSTPIMAGAAFSIFDNFKAGVSFYTPYGSAINWTDNWPGAVLSQNVALKVYTIQPTFAWRPFKNLSIGLGVMLTWGTIDLNKGLVAASSMDRLLGALGQEYRFGETTPASVNLNGTAAWRVGVNVGAMYDILPNLTVGASFRSEMKMKVKAGDASVSYANPIAENILSNQIGILNNANFSAEMPCPWIFSFGVAWKPIRPLTLAVDARLTGWSAYKNLDIDFLSEQLDAFDQHIQKNYKDSWAVSIGAQYALTKRFDVRAGVMIDTTPVNSEFYNPETPGMTKVEPSVGLSFRPMKGLSVDLAFMYVAGCGAKNTSCEYVDFIAANQPALGLPPIQKFEADYKLHAIIPSIGLSYAF